MSLILDALRRSEAARRRGELPRLIDGAAPAPNRRSAWRPLLAGLLLGLLVALFAAAWIGRDGRAREPGTVAPAPAPTPTSERPALPLVDARTDDPTWTPPPRAAVQSPADADTTAATAATAAMVSGRTAPPAIPSMDSAPAGPAPGAAMPNPAAPDAPMLDLARLDPALRAGLPPLRVSLHAYAADPARRFAIIDGQRRREGDLLAPGLHLREIQRDGLALDWRGRTLWVPR